MDVDEFRELLQGAGESPQLEFKESMPWDGRKFARHIIAMSNLRDGGRIIIGIKNGTLDRLGVDAQSLATYVEEDMQDQIAKFADPFVQFNVSRINDGGLQFVVIEVASFEETPTILRESVDGENPNEKIEKGRLLIRSRYGRPKSCQIERVDELRELIELAVARRTAKLRSLGILPIATDLAAPEHEASYDYDAELGDIL